MPVARRQIGATYAFDELAEDNQLRGLSRERLPERLAHHYDQVNHLHPFREGNGRAQRLFWSQCLESAGWSIDWRDVQGAENDHASRAAADGDLAPLRTMFDRELRPLESTLTAASHVARLALRGSRSTETDGPGR